MIKQGGQDCTFIARGCPLPRGRGLGEEHIRGVRRKNEFHFGHAEFDVFSGNPFTSVQ